MHRILLTRVFPRVPTTNDRAVIQRLQPLLVLFALSIPVTLLPERGNAQSEESDLSPAIVIRTDDEEVNADLKRAEEALDRADFTAAIAIYQDLLLRVRTLTGAGKNHDGVHGYGDPPQRIFLGTRAFVRRKLASLPRESIEKYRKRYESQASDLLDTSHRRHDSDGIREVADSYPVTKAGYRARLLLGDLALEQGALARAERHYRDLLEENLPLLDQEQVAEVTSRLALCFDASATPRPIQVLKERYASRCGGAKIWHQGSQVQWESAITDFAALPPRAEAIPEPSSSSSWTTFGGNNARTGTAPDISGTVERKFKSPRYLPTRPKRSIPPRLGYRPSEILSWPSPLYPSYPVVDEKSGVVYSFDDTALRALNLKTGTILWEKTTKDIERDIALLFPPPKALDPSIAGRVTPLSRVIVQVLTTEDLDTRPGRQDNPRPVYLSVSGRYLLAMIDVLIFPSSGRPIKVLLALDRYNEGEMLWSAGAKPFGSPLLEGLELTAAPVVHGTRVYVGGRRIKNERKAFVLGLDLETGEPIFWTFLCSGPNSYPSEDPDPETPCLSEAGGVLYCSTGLGVLAALNSESGEVRWLYRYKRFPLRGPQGPITMSYRNPWRDEPLIVSEDRLYSSPPDSSELHILFLTPQAESGFIVNDTVDKENLDYVLGVSQGWIFLAGRSLDGRQQIVTAVHPDATNTAQKWDFAIPNPPPDREAVDHLRGRGLVGLNLIYVPTEKAIYALDKKTGRVANVIDRASPGSSDPVETGNLIPARGGLLLATPKGLSFFARSD